MEYTDCDNCLYLEAQNADLLVENEELREQIEAYLEVIENFRDAVDGI